MDGGGGEGPFEFVGAPNVAQSNQRIGNAGADVRAGVLPARQKLILSVPVVWLVVAHHVGIGVVGAFFFEMMIGGTKGQKQRGVIFRLIFCCGDLVDSVLGHVLGGAVHLKSPECHLRRKGPGHASGV